MTLWSPVNGFGWVKSLVKTREHDSTSFCDSPKWKMTLLCHQQCIFIRLSTSETPLYIFISSIYCSQMYIQCSKTIQSCSKAVCCGHYPREGGISGLHPKSVSWMFNRLHPYRLPWPTADSGSHGVSSTAWSPTVNASHRPILYGSSLWVHQPSNYDTDKKYLQWMHQCYIIFTGLYRI